MEEGCSRHEIFFFVISNPETGKLSQADLREEVSLKSASKKVEPGFGKRTGRAFQARVSDRRWQIAKQT